MSPKDYRKKLGLTQAEMGQELGISQMHVSALERGYRMPTVKISMKYAVHARANRKGTIRLEDFPAVAKEFASVSSAL